MFNGRTGYSIKRGRGLSKLQAFRAIFSVIFGIGWTIFALTITRDAPWPIVRMIFPLAGILGVCLAIGNAWYHWHNATQPNRFAEYDIEPTQGASSQADALAAAFCRHCGRSLDTRGNFCPGCGKSVR